MDYQLDEIEQRVLGCLAEKDLATPQYYPLTLNALTNACNQKSNRDPVMALEKTDVVRALDSLRRKQLALQSAEGVRSAKYCHNLDGLLNLDPEEMAVIAELLLRGPQTVGELRNRAERMCPVGDLDAADALVQNLIDRETPLVTRLPRQPGRKESRFAHLFAGEPDLSAETVAAPVEPARLKVAAEAERLEALEQTVQQLRNEVEELRQQLKDFQAQFE